MPLTPELRQYGIITANYWAFTLTDGALRMLVLLYFHQLGYTPLEIALLFLFYEFFGIVTNLVGGWLGAKLGLNTTMNIGLGLQVAALAMLLLPTEMLTVIWVMTAQAICGIAKDLNKMSAKSAIKLLVPDDAKGSLFKWVAILTGSKNALKGAGFFLGGVLLAYLGFSTAIAAMTIFLTIVWLSSLFLLKRDLGKSRYKPKFKDILSKSHSVNRLSAARLFLFCSRDVWFVVALPVFLASQLNWGHEGIGTFMACWIIGYGLIQSIAPYFTGKKSGRLPDGKTAFAWALSLAVIPCTIAIAISQSSISTELAIVLGLLIFGAFFAINSSLHSYLIVSYAKEDGVSLDIGFYYMANAKGRLIGTVLSGWIYQIAGLEACLWLSSLFLLIAALISLSLPRHHTQKI